GLSHPPVGSRRPRRVPGRQPGAQNASRRRQPPGHIDSTGGAPNAKRSRQYARAQTSSRGRDLRHRGAVVARRILRRPGVHELAIRRRFELAGIIALVSGIGVIASIVLSVGEEAWIIAAAIALGLPVWKGRRVIRPARSAAGP